MGQSNSVKDTKLPLFFAEAKD